jgi:hypothetical protein
MRLNLVKNIKEQILIRHIARFWLVALPALRYGARTKSLPHA